MQHFFLNICILVVFPFDSHRKLRPAKIAVNGAKGSKKERMLQQRWTSKPSKPKMLKDKVQVVGGTLNYNTKSEQVTILDNRKSFYLFF